MIIISFLSKYFLSLIILLIILYMVIYFLNNSKNQEQKISIFNMNTKNIELLYLPFNQYTNLKNNIKICFIKLIMLINTKNYTEMENSKWIEKSLISNLKKYENFLKIYAIKNVINVEILSFIGNLLKVKVISEHLNIENKFFYNILNLKMNIFNENIHIINMYLNQQNINFVYSGLYLSHDWKDKIVEQNKINGVI